MLITAQSPQCPILVNIADYTLNSLRIVSWKGAMFSLLEHPKREVYLGLRLSSVSTLKNFLLFLYNLIPVRDRHLIVPVSCKGK